MDNTRWDVVLVEWINCLKLTKPVKHIKDLRDGHFLRNLLQILAPYSINEVSADIIIVIYDFIKQHYPDYNLELEKSNLEELNKNDLIAITTLLMHYSCIFDRREQLTSPLCHKLTENIQLHIRTFLERFSGKILREELQRFVDESVNLDSSITPSSIKWIQENSPLSTKSPLQDFLRTPTSRSRFIDKEIKKLKTALELERFEKADLHEELKAHQNKIKKIGEQLDEKTLEIKRLRSELVALENKEPPFYKSDGSCDVQRRYLSEIQNLEQYVSQLQNEQEELQTDRDNLKDKLRKSEHQLELCQKKLYTLENENEVLTDRSQMQEIEIQQLRSQCNELNGLLSELKTKTNDSCIEVDGSLADIRSKVFEGSQSFEDLAHAVVDIQLREAHKENCDLKSVLKELQANEIQLNKEIEDWKLKFNNVNSSYEDVQHQNEELFKKATLLVETQKELDLIKIKLQEVSESLCTSSNKNNEMEQEIILLNAELTQSRSKILELDDINKTFKDDLIKLEKEYNNLNTRFEEKDKQHSKLDKEYESLKGELNRAIAKYTTADFELKALHQRFNHFDCTMETCLKNLEHIICGNNTLNMENKHDAFKSLLDKLKQNIACDLNDKKTLTNQVNTLEKLTQNLQEEISVLSVKEALGLQEKETLQKDLKELEDHTAILELDVKRYKEKILDLNNNVLKLDATITDLQNLLSDRDKNICELQNAQGTLQEELKSKNHMINLKCVEEDKLIQAITGFEIETKKLEGELEKKRQELESALEEVSRKNVIEVQLSKTVATLEAGQKNLNLELQEKQKVIDEKSTEISNKEQKELELNNLVRNLEQEKGSILDDLKLQKRELECKTSDIKEGVVREANLMQTVDNLEKENKTLKETIGQKDEGIQEQLKVQSNLESQKCCLEETVARLERQRFEEVKTLNEKISKYEGDISILQGNLNDTQVQYEKKIEELSNCIQNKEEEIASYNEQIVTLNKKIELVEVTVSKLEEELHRTTLDKQNLQKYLDGEIELNKQMKIDMDDKYKNIEKLKDELFTSTYKLELKENDICKAKNQNENLMKELDQLRKELEEKDLARSALETDFKQLNTEIENSQQCIELLEFENKDLKQTITELENQIRVLKDLKCQLETKCTDFEENTEKIISDLSEKNGEFESVVDAMRTYKENTEKELQELKQAFSDSTEKVEELSKQKNNLIFEHERQIEVMNNEISNLNLKVSELNTKEAEHFQEIKVAKEELSDVMIKYTQALETYQDTKCDYETQVNSLTENLHEIVEKYNLLDKEQADVSEKFSGSLLELEKLKSEKLALENKLVQQKNSYDKKFEEINSQLTLEIQNLQGEKVRYEKDLELLRNQLGDANSKNNQLVEKVKEVAERLNNLENEKSDLVDKYLALEKSHKKLDEEFAILTTTHENYKFESEVNTKQVKNELEGAIHNLENEKEDLQKQLKAVNESMLGLQLELSSRVSKHEESMQEKESIVEKLQTKLVEYENNILKLKEEQLVLGEQIELEKSQHKEIKDRYNEQTRSGAMKIEDLENNITKLKCANAILETGKEKLQNEHDKLLISISKIEDLLVSKEAKFVEEVKLKEFEISKLKSLVDTLESDCKDKQTLIEELRFDLDLINTNLEQLKNDKGTVQQSLLDMEKIYKEKIEDTKQNYKSKLAEMEYVYKSLRMQHENVTKEMNGVTNKNAELNDKLNALLKEKTEMENTLAEEKTSLAKLKETLLLQEQTIREHENDLTDKNNTIQETLSDVEQLIKEKSNVEVKLKEMSAELEKLQKSRDEILESQSRIIKETENNIQQAHQNAKNGLLKRIEIMESEMSKEQTLRLEIESVLEQEKQSKTILNVRIIELENEKAKIERLNTILKRDIKKLACLVQEKPAVDDDYRIEDLNSLGIEALNEVMADIETRILEIFHRKRELSEVVVKLEKEQKLTTEELDRMAREKVNLAKEKDDLLCKYEILQKEKRNLSEDFKESCVKLNAALAEKQVIKSKCEEELKNNQGSDKEQLEAQVAELNSINLRKYNDYQQLVNSTSEQKAQLEKLVALRNEIETIVENLKQTLIVQQIKTEHITEDGNQKVLFEKKQALQIIIEDIKKQFARMSKQINNSHTSMMNIIEKTIQEITSGKTIVWENLYKDVIPEELPEKLENCKDHAEDAIEQLKAFEAAVEKSSIKVKLQKENVLQTANKNASANVKEDDWKKKHFALKQRLTLAENAKNNFEKKLKQLREENKRLTERSNNIDNDQHYKILLQQHIQTKEEYEKSTKEYNTQYTKLLQEFEQYKALNKMEVKAEDSSKLKLELQQVRDAYGSVLTEKSKLELDNATLCKVIDDRNAQLSELMLIKEAYEKLLEDNNKLMTEIDTIKYKRTRDREEYVRLLKKQRDECDTKESRKIQEIRSEYEGKLEKMKERMIKLYKEEVDKEMQKVSVEKDENVFLLRTIAELKEDLKDARTKIQKIELERSKALEEVKHLEKELLSKKRDAELYTSRESLASLTSRDGRDGNLSRANIKNRASNFEVSSRNVRSSTSSLGREPISRRTLAEDRRTATLPRTVEEVTKRSAVNSVPPDLGQNFEMEDEGELFNNKYLTDLKEGRCLPPSGRESTSSRMSELAFRNSLCPPHLKSSYPAETQFTSPTYFKEEDIKSGNVEFDDSMSSKLLPWEKPRVKKDIGTTSYKKPGPPTPSKNGGRVSLESNKIHPKDILREQNDGKTPKRTTPNRLKALFMGKNTSSRDTSENQPATPNRTKRLSIFRKPR